MAGFSSASMFIKIALGLGAGAVIFDIIGFPTPYWTSIDIAGTTLSNGLFEYCSGETCKSITEAMSKLVIISISISISISIINIIISSSSSKSISSRDSSSSSCSSSSSSSSSS